MSPPHTPRRGSRDDDLFAAVAASCLSDEDSSVATPLIESPEEDGDVQLTPSSKELFDTAAASLQAAARGKRARLSKLREDAQSMNMSRERRRRHLGASLAAGAAIVVGLMYVFTARVLPYGAAA